MKEVKINNTCIGFVKKYNNIYKYKLFFSDRWVGKYLSEDASRLALKNRIKDIKKTLNELIILNDFRF